MLTEKYTLLELNDLALCKPEAGRVNFNILHTVLRTIIIELNLEEHKTPCDIADEIQAEFDLDKGRGETDKKIKRSLTSAREELKEKAKAAEDQILPRTSTSSEKGAEESAPVEESPGSTVKDQVLQRISRPSQKGADELPTAEESLGSSGKDQVLQDISAPSEEGGADELVPAEESPVSSTEGAFQGEETIDQLKKTAQALMEVGAEEIAQQTEAVSEALKEFTDEGFLEKEPIKILEELWEMAKVKQRVVSAEEGIKKLFDLIKALLDAMDILEDKSGNNLDTTKTMLDDCQSFFDRVDALEEAKLMHDQSIEECNAKRDEEVERIENIISNLRKEVEETKGYVRSLETNFYDLSDKVAYKDDVEDLRGDMTERLDVKINDMTKFVREIEGTLTKKSDFEELVSQVDDLEDRKVNRDDIKRLLEPGFIDGFLKELANLRTDAENFKAKVIEIEDSIESLRNWIEEEIRQYMENKVAEIHASLDTINKKLARLDPDEINDSFANLEEQVSFIIKELEELKQAFKQFQKEARFNFNKIPNLMDLIDKLDQKKVSKVELYELLALKADIETVRSKLERDEFVVVVSEIKDEQERLTITVKINEEEMIAGFNDIRHELVLKMYTGDFITATEPIRNRIKALIYELEKVKEICLTHLFPDAPGITKCISCKRGAHLAGPKYAGDANVELPEEVAPQQRVVMAIDKSALVSQKLPPIDLDSVPIPPVEHPRERNPLKLPTLFATARPNIGLEHPKSKREIDKQLDAYFATGPVRPIDGEHTKTDPQQRGLKFTALHLPQTEKEEVLLQGIDRGYYRGSLHAGSLIDVDSSDKDVKPDVEQTKKKPKIKSLRRARKGLKKPVVSKPKKTSDRETVDPAVVSLHVDDEPVQKTVSVVRKKPKH